MYRTKFQELQVPAVMAFHDEGVAYLDLDEAVVHDGQCDLIRLVNKPTLFKYALNTLRSGGMRIDGKTDNWLCRGTFEQMQKH
jgi:hypothetical protein